VSIICDGQFPYDSFVHLLFLDLTLRVVYHTIDSRRRCITSSCYLSLVSREKLRQLMLEATSLEGEEGSLRPDGAVGWVGSRLVGRSGSENGVNGLYR